MGNANDNRKPMNPVMSGIMSRALDRLGRERGDLSFVRLARDIEAKAGAPPGDEPADRT